MLFLEQSSSLFRLAQDLSCSLSGLLRPLTLFSCKISLLRSCRFCIIGGLSLQEDELGLDKSLVVLHLFKQIFKASIERGPEN